MSNDWGSVDEAARRYQAARVPGAHTGGSGGLAELRDGTVILGGILGAIGGGIGAVILFAAMATIPGGVLGGVLGVLAFLGVMITGATVGVYIGAVLLPFALLGGAAWFIYAIIYTMRLHGVI